MHSKQVIAADWEIGGGNPFSRHVISQFLLAHFRRTFHSNTEFLIRGLPSTLVSQWCERTVETRSFSGRFGALAPLATS
jgi:hypothetical protein